MARLYQADADKSAWVRLIATAFKTSFNRCHKYFTTRPLDSRKICGQDDISDSYFVEISC